MLLDTPAQILATYIRTQAEMTDPDDNGAWPLYVSWMPDAGAVTNCGAAYDTDGNKDGRLMSDGTVIQHFGIQLKTRCDDYNTGWTKLEAVAIDLDGLLNEAIVVGGNNYEIQNVSRKSLVTSLGAEEGTQGRQLFTIDLLVTVKIIT